MKAIIKTAKAINLVDPQTREFLTEDPQVVFWTQFKEARTGKGQIKILAGDLPDEASDEEFQKFLKDSGKVDLAVAAYMSSLALVDEAEDDIEAKAAADKAEAEAAAKAAADKAEAEAAAKAAADEAEALAKAEAEAKGKKPKAKE